MVSGNTFWLNITNSSQADAEAACSANGGHLAAYLSIEEQKEVEQVGALELVAPPLDACVQLVRCLLHLHEQLRTQCLLVPCATPHRLLTFLPPFTHLQFYIKGGYLLPKFHQNYWIGFQASSWPTFQQIDRTFTTKYRNWGT